MARLYSTYRWARIQFTKTMCRKTKKKFYPSWQEIREPNHNKVSKDLEWKWIPKSVYMPHVGKKQMMKGLKALDSA